MLEKRDADRSLTREQRKERAKQAARVGRRASYDLPPALIHHVRRIGEKERTPASQVAAALLAHGLRRYWMGEIDLRAFKVPSDSPRYEWNLNLERLLEKVSQAVEASGEA